MESATNCMDRLQMQPFSFIVSGLFESEGNVFAPVSFSAVFISDEGKIAWENVGWVIGEENFDGLWVSVKISWRNGWTRAWVQTGFFTAVLFYLFVCLVVIVSQRLANRFQWNLVECPAMGQGPIGVTPTIFERIYYYDQIGAASKCPTSGLSSLPGHWVAGR